MPGISSPYRPGHAKQQSTSPLPPLPPSKPIAIDLNSSTRSTDRETGAKITRRAFFCDVVVEREGPETTTLLQHLGRPLPPLSTLPAPSLPLGSSHPTTPSRLSQSTSSDDDDDSPMMWTREQQEQNAQRLANLVEELVRTEKSYLSRIVALKNSYADPLRNFARHDYSKIIPMYEAKTLFSNIDALVPAAAAFHIDLEAMFKAGTGAETVGDVCLKHFKELKTFDPYRPYLSKQDESQRMFQDVLKKYSSFGAYIERTKYQTTGIGNIGLRELLMEPVQRIPRYTLLWQTMIKCLPPLSPQRAKLLECVEIASRIARCEPDPQTVRATVMYCLERNVEGFPANLFSNNRDFIDSIDCDDLPAFEYPTQPSPGSRLPTRPASSGSASTSASLPSLGSGSGPQLPTTPGGAGPSSGHYPLHCTLFLFDDKLMIVKRQSSAVSGRKVTGLDDVQKLVKSGGGVAIMDKNGAKKDKLSYRGIVDVLDIMATDVGNGDFHLFFQSPPADQGDRWSSRPFRSYTTVQPPYGSTIDPVAIRKDKGRFLQSLWAAQAQARAKVLPKQADTKAIPRVLAGSEEYSLEPAGETHGRAKAYFDVWERNGWTGEKRKAKVAIHIDEDDMAPELPAADRDPCMVIRLQPMSGGLCRFSFATAANDGEARVVIDITEVAERIITTIHRFGIFKFRTSASSCPTTPTSTGHRLRPSMLNLDAISRNLFGHQSMSSRSQSSADTFGSSLSRKKSTVSSKASTIGSAPSSGTISSDDKLPPTRLSLVTSNSSPGAMSSGDDDDAPRTARPSQKSKLGNGHSEMDLDERLNLARRNSKSMAALRSPTATSSNKFSTKSVAELRSQVEERATRSAELDRQNTRLSTKSAVDLRGRKLAAEEALREAMRSGSPTPMSPTAPLRVRNRSASPARALEIEQDAPKPPPKDYKERSSASPLPFQTPSLDTVASHGHTPSVSSVLDGTFEPAPRVPSPSPERPAPMVMTPLTIPERSAAASPGLRGPAPLASPASPRPLGPRLPGAARPLPTTPGTIGIGSAHTKLRVVSGNGRKISMGREMIPLKSGDENEPPSGAGPPSPPGAAILAKRQHDADQGSPRKRSPTRSPLQPRSSTASDAPEVPSPRISSGGLRKASNQNRRLSGHSTPRKTSASRRISGTHSIVSQHTGASTVEPSPPQERRDVSAALGAVKQRLNDSRAGVKKMKGEVQTLRKQLGVEAPRPASLYGSGSLPRSPHRLNISRLADEMMEDGTLRPRGNTKPDSEAVLLDETARSLGNTLDKLDIGLRSAMVESEQAELLAVRLAAQCVEREIEVRELQAQVHRGKETQELLRQQVADVQVEVDVIYEAFNTELDGMFNDIQLAPAEAFEALKREVQEAKAARNAMALENMRLKRELQEANMQREQWSRVLVDRGL